MSDSRIRAAMRLECSRLVLHGDGHDSPHKIAPAENVTTIKGKASRQDLCGLP